MSKHSHVKKLKPYDQVSLNRAVFKVGAKWCRACKECKPEYEELAEKYDKIKFYSIDSDAFDEDRSEMKEIRKICKDTKALPTFFFFRNGKLVNQLAGFKGSKFKIALSEL